MGGCCVSNQAKYGGQAKGKGEISRMSTIVYVSCMVPGYFEDPQSRAFLLFFFLFLLTPFKVSFRGVVIDRWSVVTQTIIPEDLSVKNCQPGWMLCDQT